MDCLRYLPIWEAIAVQRSSKNNSTQEKVDSSNDWWWKLHLMGSCICGFSTRPRSLGFSTIEEMAEKPWEPVCSAYSLVFMPHVTEGHMNLAFHQLATRSFKRSHFYLERRNVPLWYPLGGNSEPPKHDRDAWMQGQCWSSLTLHKLASGCELLQVSLQAHEETPPHRWPMFADYCF